MIQVIIGLAIGLAIGFFVGVYFIVLGVKLALIRAYAVNPLAVKLFAAAVNESREHSGIPAHIGNWLGKIL